MVISTTTRLFWLSAFVILYWIYQGSSCVAALQSIRYSLEEITCWAEAVSTLDAIHEGVLDRRGDTRLGISGTGHSRELVR